MCSANLLPTALVLACAVGCYRPTGFAHCELRCETVCPDGLVCGANQICHASGRAECTGVIGEDAAMPIDAPACVGRAMPPFHQVCPTSFRPAKMVNTPETIDTSTCDLRHSQSEGPTLCVIAFERLTISSTLVVFGPEPAILIGRDGITVTENGAILAASTQTEARPAPGRNFSTCAQMNGNSTDTASGAGGGAGGSFSFAGGGGGNGQVLGALPAPVVTTPKIVRGGCRGGRGGAGPDAGPLGGSSGGAVYLMSNGRIQIDGTINASGAGGAAAGTHDGGAGGGSGGMILLDGNPLSVGSAAKIFALGGGGSPGGGEVSGGNAGDDPGDVTDYATTTQNSSAGSAGTGGGAQLSGTSGGPGGGIATCSGAGGCGGGGGGAGAGFVITPNVGIPANNCQPPPSFPPPP